MALHGAKGEILFQKRTSPFESPKRKAGGVSTSPPAPLTTKREGRSPSFLDYPPRASDGAALLRSPLWGAAFLAFCWIAIANRFIGDDVL